MTTATFPVEIDFTPPRKKYAKGGLAAKAGQVEKASVGPDTKLIHVNQKEYEWLKSQFGPPVKNPKTGLDTFGFLDFLIPAAASIFLGPAVGGIVGGAMGLGETASGLLGGALAGAGGAALTGGNPLTGALVGGGANYLGLGNGLQNLLSGAGALGGAAAPAATTYGGYSGIPETTSGSSSGIFGNLFGGQGSSNPFMKAAPYLLMASALGGGGGQKQAAPVPIQDNQNKVPLSNVEFNRTQTNPTVTANYGYGPEQSFFANNALPTVPKPNTTATAAAHGKYVKGGGTGTSDDIPAVLSDGEYVIDAQTVSMLGDGSSDAGAAKLDKMREEIRKHKGKALAQGKFAPNAKGPLSYMKRA
jgi:hypothetical protein